MYFEDIRDCRETGHLDWKVRKIGTFQSFFLPRESVLRYIFEHFPHIPRKENLIEIPVELRYYLFGTARMAGG